MRLLTLAVVTGVFAVALAQTAAGDDRDVIHHRGSSITDDAAVIIQPVQNQVEPRYYLNRRDPWRFRLDPPFEDWGYRYAPYTHGYNWRYRYDPQWRYERWRYRYDPAWRYRYWDDRLDPYWRYDPYYRLDTYRYDPRYDPRLDRYYDRYDYYYQDPRRRGALDYYIPPTLRDNRSLDNDLRVW